MIKSHRPRGHFWTCASQFQGSKTYREVEYEDCIAPEDAILAKDSDAELTSSGRAAKRRRIENTVHDFMVGVPIRIESTGFRARSLTTAVERNRRSMTEQHFILPDIRTRVSTSATWAEVEDRTIIGNSQMGGEKTKKRDCRFGRLRRQPREVEVPTETFVQSNCSPAKLRKQAPLRSGPSTAALKKAAALRDCRLLRTENEAPVPRLRFTVTDKGSFSAPASTVKPPHSLREGAQDRRVQSRRKTMQDFRDDEDSGDELRCSRVETPMMLLNTRSPLSPSTISTSIDETIQPNAHNSISERGAVPSYTQGRGIPISNRGETCETSATIPYKDWQEDNHDTLERYRKTCASASSPDVRLINGVPSTVLENTVVPPFNQQPRAHMSNVGSSGYITAPMPNDGSTPLMYRKRGGKQHKRGGRATHDSVPPRRRATFPSSEGGDVILRKRAALESMVVDVEAPLAKTPLLDAHLNKELANVPNSRVNKSSLQSALRREMRNSGARITSVHGNVPSSSPGPAPEAGDQHDPEPHIPSEQADPNPPAAWIGTQNLLHQAERELFGSQLETAPTLVEVDVSPEHDKSTDQDGPLCEMPQTSQEHMGTQTLVEMWSPWSTVKKPHVCLSDRLSANSPSLTGRQSTIQPSVSAQGQQSPGLLDVTPAAHSAGHRRSSARPSNTVTKCLEFPTRKSQAFLGSDGQNASAAPVPPKSTLHKSMKERDEHLDPTSASLRDFVANYQELGVEFPTSTTTAGHPMASYQGAQLLRDDSQLSNTINDLTTSVLRMDDMNGVLSQV